MENKLNNIISLLQSMEKQMIKIESRLSNLEKKIYFKQNPDPLNPDFPPYNPHNPMFPKHPIFPNII